MGLKTRRRGAAGGLPDAPWVWYAALAPGCTPEEALARGAERDCADTENLRHLYDIDHHDEAYYNLIVDTSRLDPEAVAERILAALEE